MTTNSRRRSQRSISGFAETPTLPGFSNQLSKPTTPSLENVGRLLTQLVTCGGGSTGFLVGYIHVRNSCPHQSLNMQIIVRFNYSQSLYDSQRYLELS